MMTHADVTVGDSHHNCNPEQGNHGYSAIREPIVKLCGLLLAGSRPWVLMSQACTLEGHGARGGGGITLRF